MTPRSVPKQGIENPFPSSPGQQEILTGLVCVCVCVCVCLVLKGALINDRRAKDSVANGWHCVCSLCTNDSKPFDSPFSSLASQGASFPLGT